MDTNGRMLAEYSTVSPTPYASFRVACLWVSVGYLVCLLLVFAYNTSSTALGTALGGYAAQGLGNTWVYVVIALAGLAVIAMSLKLMPTGTLPPEDDRGFSQQERLRIRRFLLSPTSLAIVLCIILPAVVATGYASFLFPLFSSEMGFEKADINNMYLFGQLIVYVSISGIEHITRRIGNWTAGFLSIAGLALVFLAFSLNTTVAWGVIVIALVGLLAKTANVWKPLYIKAAGNADVPLGWATGAMFVARSCCRIAKPFILGCLVITGQRSIIILAAFFLVCATAFCLTTRDKNL